MVQPREAIFPPLHKSDVLACQFSSWYPRFKRHSPKATIIRPIPQEDDLLEYLESDGLFIPEGSGPNGISELSDSDDDDEEDTANEARLTGDDSDSDSDSDSPPAKQFEFPQLDAEIRSVIDKYDGAVFPKLNWSSPQDAAWMIPGQNLKCQTPGDVYLLLKSSDFISHDLDHAFDECVDFDASSDSPTSTSPSENVPLPMSQLSISENTDDSTSRSNSSPRRPYSFELVLKKWFDMPESQEWRCFVRDGQLVGISQRDTTFYDFLQSPETQRRLKEQIQGFWVENVKREFPLSNYTLDVYLTRDHSKTFIIDFNPYSSTTDSLLFTYAELSQLSSPSTRTELPILRTVDNDTAKAGGAMPRYSHNRYPKDVVELSEGQSVAEFAKVWGEKLANATAPVDKDLDGR